MTQKDKVKELVGRGLNSYHTKALQQMDRIEKKNKEQYHKISILTNELDNDYLTKTEEGSVVSLEHSKEGMVYLDELQGNTLVNYCTDGSKEMTLNGDIDVEGTFVTTTEGVDNGKVDVMCEGNTLVNLVDLSKCKMYVSELKMCSYTISEDLSWQEVGVSGRDVVEKLKPNTDYTVFMYIQENTVKNDSAFYMNMSASDRAFVTNPKIPTGYTGLIIRKLVTKEDFSGVTTALLPTIKDAKQGQKVTFKYMIIEGDLTNIENLEYFEGMKSVGQDDENGHKIEILSQNKNLFNPQEVYEGGYSFGVPFINSTKCQQDENGVFTRITSSSSWNVGIGFHIKTEKNMDYTLSIGEYYDDGVHMELRGLGIYKSEYPFVNNSNMQSYSNRVKGIRLNEDNNSLVYNSKDYDYILFYIGGEWNPDANGAKTFKMSKIEVNQSSVKPNNYTEPKYNKKEILLNEPLVGNDTVKDRVVKIGGKLFIERFWETVTLDGTQEIVKGNWDVPIFSYYVPNTEGEPTNFPNTLICDRIKPQSFNLNDNTHYALYTGKDSVETKRYIRMQIPTSIVAKDDLEGFKTWLRNNPVTIAYRLNTPIYDPLEVEPTLNAYNDVTHISNDSLIPCNMKIQNSGYNAIIKPSTLYTVALDTDKSGTIGMNLGGTKGTTTNNVLTLTTPTTLTDDSLRLHGKGIKGSKVRLLEGDKTNWIPSHFEGMKSSFEDKFDATDNTYKMEILSNNKNVLNLDDIVMKGIGTGCKLDACSTDLIQYTSNQAEWTQIFFMMKLKPFTRYTLSAELQSMNVYVFNDRVGSWDANKYIGAMQNTTNTLQKKQYSFTTNKNGCISIRFTNEMMLGVNIAKNIMLSEVVGEYIPKKSNKIQFSSIEPLRGIENIKDKFVFKDGKLMVQRNLGEVLLNGDHNCSYAMYDLIMNHYNVYFRMTNVVTNKKTGGLVDNDKLPTYKTILYSEDVCGFGTNDKWFGNGFSLRLPRMIVGNGTDTEILNKCKQWLAQNPIKAIYQLEEPTYEDIPHELQKIILEGYENGTLFFDTNIPPTSTVTYAGETPIVKSVKLNKTEVLNNTNDINDNIIPYLMDMDYRVVCLQLESNIEGISMARLFGGTYEMLKRDILSKRYSVEEYKYRLDAYLSVNKITEKEYEELGEMLNE